jgi:hypothetical protein
VLVTAAPPTAAFRSSSPVGRFLEYEGGSRPGDDRYPPRNFRLDEGVTDARSNSYESIVAHPTWATWERLHNRYLDRHVAWKSGELPPRHVQPTFRGTPQTFGSDALLADFGSTSRNVMLVRVTTPAGIAWAARVAPSRVEDALSRPGGLEPLLALASRSRGRHPDFAGFWDDLRELLPEDEGKAPAGWADALRNRLGLSHYRARPRRPVRILVFRFPVARVPRYATARGPRALAVPTVLDSRRFEPFCPAPLGQEAGRVVDLSAELEEPAREVLLPPIRMRESDLFRIGQLENEETPDLTDARRGHLMFIRDEMGRSDYGDATDADLM